MKKQYKTGTVIIDGVRLVAVTTKRSDGQFSADVIVGTCDSGGHIDRILAVHRAGVHSSRSAAKSRAREKRAEVAHRILAGDIPQ